MPPVRVFLFLAVWAPSALILLGCYMYVYLVARAHARAIYTVELSFRNQTQTLALPRYGQTLAVTVGAFFILWLPFQTCMLLDIFCGTNILSDLTIWLGLPILAHSGTNPWIYAFHHGEMRIAAGKIAEDLVSLFGVSPSRYGCSPTRRGSNTNLELAEVNNSNEERRPPVEDYFAAKHHQSIVYTSKRCLDSSSKNVNISAEKIERSSASSDSCKQIDVVEENIHDLTKMLDPKYIIDRNHVIDSNHNIDKIKNLKYLLDPTFSKIRHLRRLNQRRMASKNMARLHESRFVSYQNLKTDESYGRKTTMTTPTSRATTSATLHMNTMSDPMLNVESPPVCAKSFNGTCAYHPQSSRGLQASQYKRKGSANLASVSDSNIREASELNLRLFQNPQWRNPTEVSSGSQRSSEQSLEQGLARNLVAQQQRSRSFSWARARQRFIGRNYCDLPSPSQSEQFKFRQTSYASLPTPEQSSSRGSPKLRGSTRQLMSLTPNRLANLQQQQQQHARRNDLTIVARSRLLEPSRLADTLSVPTIHSEPPSPIDPLQPLDALQEEDSSRSTADFSRGESAGNPLLLLQQRNLKSPTIRHSDPIIPSVLLNVEDFSEQQQQQQQQQQQSPVSRLGNWSNLPPVSPEELSDLLLRYADESPRFADSIFPEHDSTRFSSRRPSDSKWSESSRSQEILSNVSEHPRFPSSLSVNNFQSCNSNSGSDLNGLASCLEPYMRSDALSSSLAESFFSAPSVPDSEDLFTSFEADEPSPANLYQEKQSSSSANLIRRQLQEATHLELQSKSTESMFRDREQNERLCAIFKLEPGIHRSRPRLRQVSCKDVTPTDVCTPTFDITVVADIKGETGLGVRV